nr:protein argonaute 2-like [Lolium perenne]
MSNRGGGFNPNRGRGYNGGAGRGNGGGRWNGGGGNFGPGRGNNFFEGSSSGTAGQGDGNRDSEYRGGGFDGVFRAGYGNSEGDRGRSNYGQGYNRTADRRPYAGQGNFAYRMTNTGTGARDTRLDSARPASFESHVQGLSAEQVLLVKEAANAFAKQLAGLSNGSQGAAQKSTAPSVVQPVAALGRQTQGVQRAEATLLAVAGIST